MNIVRLSLFSVLTLATSLWAALTIAQAQPTASAASANSSPKPIAIPESHHQTSQRSVSVDGVAATLTRYERRDGRNAGLGGEHFSTLIATDGTLKGFASISLDLVGKPLPSRERSEQIAIAFLRESAPDLLPHMRISGTAPHDEPIRVRGSGGEETVQLAGMRVKARNTSDGSWFWVVVGADEKPLLFERDLQWSNLRFRRTTEEWLHDRWLRGLGPDGNPIVGSIKNNPQAHIPLSEWLKGKSWNYPN